MHGKTSEITHRGVGVFAGLPSPLTATRYHSLTLAPESVPAELEVTAVASDGTVMGIRHRHHEVEGVQFHPESILTTSGHALLANFLGRCTPSRRRALRLGPQNRRIWARTIPNTFLGAYSPGSGAVRAQIAKWERARPDGGGTEVEGASARPDPPRRPPAPFKSKQPCSRAGQTRLAQWPGAKEHLDDQRPAARNGSSTWRASSADNRPSSTTTSMIERPLSSEVCTTAAARS